MPLESDLLIDRHRLKRRLAVWRIVAVLAVVLAGVVAIPGGARVGGQHIARYTIAGMIGDGREQIEALADLRKDSSVSAILLHLDTPGGAVSGGEGIHAAVESLAAVKPVVAVMDGMAASAGYMIAVATPHIVARESTLTGSIGVIMELGDISGLLEKIGVKPDQLVSGPLKGQPSFTQPLSGPGRAYLQGLVMDLFEQFVGLVAQGRHMDPAKVRTLADGRAFTGRQALAAGLVDEIGGEAEAITWLQSQRHLPADLPVTDVLKGTWIQRMAATSLSSVVVAAKDALRVDGVWAVWQPSLDR
jgi:protease-4